MQSIPVFLDKAKLADFKSKHHPGQCKELETFEKDLHNIVYSLKYKKLTDNFGDQIKEDIFKFKDIQKVNRMSGNVNQFGSQRHS